MAETAPDAVGSADRIDAGLRGALLGARAGALSAVLDVASTILWLSDARDQARLAIAVIAIGTAAGGIVGGAVGLALGGAIGRPAPIRAHALRLAWLLGPALAPVAWLLFSGGAMRRLPAVMVLR